MMRNTPLIKKGISSLIILQVILFALSFVVSCSDNKVSAGGNTSEVGSPEMLGTLALNNGKQNRASFARVYCIPIDYNSVKEDTSSYYSTIADSMGNFVFDSLPNGLYNFEAFFNDSQGVVYALRESGIHIQKDSTWKVNLTIPTSGSLKIYLSNIKDSIANLSIVGSSYNSAAKIFEDEIGTYATFTNIPSAYYDSIQIAISSDMIVLNSIFVKEESQEIYNSNNTIRTHHISLNTAANGIDLQDTLNGFPLFIRLNDIDSLNRESIIKHLNTLKIYQEPASDETSYKVVYDKDSIPSGLWIRLTTLYPQREMQKITLSWEEVEDSNISAVNTVKPFSLSDNFIAAWDFNEDAFPESTIYAAGDNDFQGYVNDITASEGIIGGAFYFNGKTSYIEIKESADYSGFSLVDTSSFTVSFWAFSEDTSTAKFLWGKSEAEYHFKYQAKGQSDACWMFKEFDESKADEWYESSIVATPETDFKQWVHFTVIKSGDSTAIYKNGKLENVTTGYNQTDEERIAGGSFVIGARKMADGNVDRVFKGMLDELFFQNKVQSEDWAKLIYLNQKPNDYWPK